MRNERIQDWIREYGMTPDEISGLIAKYIGKETPQEVPYLNIYIKSEHSIEKWTSASLTDIGLSGKVGIAVFGFEGIAYVPRENILRIEAENTSRDMREEDERINREIN